MAAINIGSENQGDAFYRYKMPRLQAVIEGRGNGIKTRVVNNVDIAKALERPPDYIVKFFGCELGAQTKFDKASGTSIVNGAHETKKLEELLEGFIKRYVQCSSCNNPETTVKIRKDNIFLKCKACGATSDVDMRHKLNTYILKNPPEDKISKAEKKLQKMEKEKLKEAAGENLDKKKKKEKKDGKKKKGSESPDASQAGEDETNGNGGRDDDDDEEEVEWMTDTSAAAVAARAAEQLTQQTAGLVTQGNIEAEKAEAKKREREERKRREEAERVAAEEAAAAQKAEEARLAEETARLKLEAEQAAGDEVGTLRAYIAANSTKDAVLYVKKLESETGLAGRAKLLYEALFGADMDTKLAAQVKKHKTLLRLFGGGEAACQAAQLVALEYLVGITLPVRQSEVGASLKALYDEDIIDEDIIVFWYEHANSGKVLGIPPAAAASVRGVAKRFYEWLKEADSEEEESEEDE